MSPKCTIQALHALQRMTGSSLYFQVRVWPWSDHVPIKRGRWISYSTRYHDAWQHQATPSSSLDRRHVISGLRGAAEDSCAMSHPMAVAGTSFRLVSAQLGSAIQTYLTTFNAFKKLFTHSCYRERRYYLLGLKELKVNYD